MLPKFPKPVLNSQDERLGDLLQAAVLLKNKNRVMLDARELYDKRYKNKKQDGPRTFTVGMLLAMAEQVQLNREHVHREFARTAKPTLDYLRQEVEKRWRQHEDLRSALTPLRKLLHRFLEVSK